MVEEKKVFLILILKGIDLQIKGFFL